MVPLVSAYRGDPQAVEKAGGPGITLAVDDVEGRDPIEQFKLSMQLMVNMTNATMLVPPTDIQVGGARGLWLAIETMRGGEKRFEADCVFVQGSSVYTLASGGPGGDFEAVRKDFEDVIKSVAFR